LVVDTSVLLPFVLSSLVIIMSPGADTFLLLRFAIRGGPPSGFGAMAGILVGLALLSLLLISGVGLLISQVPLALGVINALGIGVLLVLAGISVRAGFMKIRAPASAASAPEAKDKPFGMSLITNVTNPKVLIFFLAFFPQFLGESQSAFWQLTLLSATFLVATVIWLVPLVYATSAAKKFFLRPRVVIAMEFTVASVFLLLAIVLAFRL
jgi:threonine/homoserine/homoserine lactone efflux protein